jgi:hypothetical protein
MANKAQIITPYAVGTVPFADVAVTADREAGADDADGAEMDGGFMCDTARMRDKLLTGMLCTAFTTKKIQLHSCSRDNSGYHC